MTTLLGKRPARRDARTLAYGRYRTAALTPPAEVHWGHGLPFAMLGNGPDPAGPPALPDGCGDCVEAGYAHYAQLICDRAGHPYAPSTAAVLGAYAAITGFNPADPSTDQGTEMLAACKFWQAAGLDGHKLTAYLAVNPLDASHVQDAVAFYGGAYIGVQLPVSAQRQATWDVTSGPDSVPGSWGGHCVVISGYDKSRLWCVTWGGLQPMTWDFFRTYCDEAFVLLARDWLAASGQSPAGLAWGQLLGDLNTLQAPASN